MKYYHQLLQEETDNFRQEEPEGGESDKKARWVRRICLIIILILLLFLLLHCCGKRNPPDGEDERPGTVDIREGSFDDASLEGMTDEEIVEALNRQVQASMITMSMNPDPTFQDGKGNLLIHNDKGNHGPIVVEIRRNDTKELIYTSPVIPLGKHINYGSLDVELPAGSYPCTAYFHYVDIASGEIMGSGGVAITLHIQ